MKNIIDSIYDFTKANHNLEKIIPSFCPSYNFLLENLNMYLTISSRLNDMHIDDDFVIEEDYPKYSLEEVDKIASDYLKNFNLFWFHKYQELKQNNLLTFTHDESQRSMVKDGKITIVLRNNIIDVLQILHELTHYIVKHPNNEIDYLFTEANASLMTRRFVQSSYNQPYYPELEAFSLIGKEQLINQSCFFEVIGTYIDIFNNNGILSYAGLLSYLKEKNLEYSIPLYTNSIHFLTDEKEALKNVEQFFEDFRYIYAEPLYYLNENSDFDLLDFFSQYLNTNSIKEVVQLFGSNYPLVYDYEVDKLLKPLAGKGYQK